MFNNGCRITEPCQNVWVRVVEGADMSYVRTHVCLGATAVTDAALAVMKTQSDGNSDTIDINSHKINS